VRARYSALRACYQRLLSRNAYAAGLFTARFVIGSEGRVRDACVDQAILDDDATAECMLDVFHSLHFDPSERRVTVIYPIRYAR
jgi:hypothetical protein